jgi:hypothetical protein
MGRAIDTRRSPIGSRRTGGRQEFVERFPSIRSCCIAAPIARAAWWEALEGTFAFYREIMRTDCAAPWFNEETAAGDYNVVDLWWSADITKASVPHR